MYEDEWNRFMRTGQVSDYLAYKGHQGAGNAADKAEKTQERGYAGFRDTYGDCNQIGADRRI